MDTSETYIKMADCPEIQEQKPKESDSYNPDNSGSWWWGDGHTHTQPYEFEDDSFIWLPRQDQLQEMVIPRYGDWARALGMLNYEMETHNFSYLYEADSMEQLWLAFVMKEKYGKVWDGGWH